MLVHPEFNPIILSIGPLQIHWYGVMYLIGFLGAYGLATYRIKTYHLDWSTEALSDFMFYCILGVVCGGRLGYMLFYNFQTLVETPWALFVVWQGGMSFHGGLLGVVLALWVFSRKYHKSMLELGDFVAPLVPLGLGMGRIGNFINGELWGRVTDVPWAMIFPQVDSQPRHPSQLYEFGLEGVLLFICVWLYAAKPRPKGAVAGLFLCCYAVFRLIAECFRQPDFGIGYIAFGWLTMGQLLSIPMLILGACFIFLAYRAQPNSEANK